MHMDTCKNVPETYIILAVIMLLFCKCVQCYKTQRSLKESRYKIDNKPFSLHNLNQLFFSCFNNSVSKIAICCESMLLFFNQFPKI